MRGAEATCSSAGAAMTADPGIVAAVDRAAAPLSLFADLIEAIPAGRDPQKVVKGFRILHKHLSRVGIASALPALYAAHEPVSPVLVGAMVGELSARIEILAERIGVAVLETGQQLQSIADRLERIKLVCGASQGSA
jgi:hypothetical protein